MKDSYSRNAEDRFIYDHFFSDRTNPGFYVDLGAGNGIENNHTLAFQNMGWKGILQDTPDLLNELTENRYGKGNKFTDIYVGTEKGRLNDILKAAETTAVDLFCIKGNVTNILKQMNWDIPVGVWCVNFEKDDETQKQTAELLKSHGYTLYANYHGSEIWKGSDLENFNGETMVGSSKEVSAKTTAIRVLVLFAVTELILNIGK